MQPEDLTIRFAGPDDAATLYDFIHQLAVYEREPDAVEATPESLRFQLSEQQPPFQCLIAEMEGNPVGFALFFHNYSTWRGKRGLYLEDLFVPPEHRRQGVGQALLRELARIARDRDCARMEWAVLNWNQPAIDFYVELDARPLNEWIIFRLTGDDIDALATG
jgi:GNAT superfamily N-acetyltransferase